MQPPRSSSPGAVEGAHYDYDSLWTSVYGDMQDHGPTHRHLRRLLLGLLDGLDYGSALEVGCGAGHNLEILRSSAPETALGGVDISAEALSRTGLRFDDAELSQLDIEAGHLDRRWELVLCSLVLEHLNDDVAALRNMREMSSKYLLLTTIAGNFERYRPWDEQMGHVRNYRRGELEAKVTAAGFTVERSVYWGFPFYSPVARLLQNRMTATAEHDASSKLAARFMYWLYWLNSSRRGDLLLLLARVDPAGAG